MDDGSSLPASPFGGPYEGDEEWVPLTPREPTHPHRSTGTARAGGRRRSAAAGLPRGKSEAGACEGALWAPHDRSLWECPPLAWAHRLAVGTDGSALLRTGYAWRWTVGNPFRTTFGCRWGHVTVGELVVILPGLALLAFLSWQNRGSVESSGSVASYSLALSFATAARNSVWSFALGVPFDRALRYHKMFGVVGVVLALVHAHAGYYSDDDDDDGGGGGGGSGSVACDPIPAWPPCHPFPGSGQYLSGFVMLLSMVLLNLTAVNPIRRNAFELFYFSHLTLAIAVVVAGLLHGGLLGVGVGLYAFDVACRAALVAIANPHKASATVLADGIVRLELRGGQGFEMRGSNPCGGSLAHKAAQYVFVAVPALSIFEWHPFSLASAPDDPVTTLYVRPVGGWTKRLRDLCARHGTLTVCIDGPYGGPEIDVEGSRYKHFLLVSGGVGATPIMSFASQILHDCERGRPVSSLRFVWCGRRVATLDALFRNGLDRGTAFGTAMAHALAGGGDDDDADENGDGGGDGNGGDAGTSSDALVDVGISADATVGSRGTTGGKGDSCAMAVELHVTRHAAGEAPLPSAVQAGRVNIDELFARVAAEVAPAPEVLAPRSEVAVLFCGPERMGESVRLACRRRWAEGAVRFYLHRESFEL